MAPAGVVDTALRADAPAQPKRSNLVPSMSSTVDDVVAWLASLGLAKYVEPATAPFTVFSFVSFPVHDFASLLCP